MANNERQVMRTSHNWAAIRTASFALAIGALAATTSVNAVAADFHHVHLSAPDARVAVAWYHDHLGGELTKRGAFHAVAYGKTVLLFWQVKAGFPGSVGSSVDHVGFSYPDIDAKLKELAAAHVEIVSGVEQEGPIKYAFAKDPWGTLIEIVEDPTITGFHHVHLATIDPQATLAWYTRAFGGQVARYAGLIPGVRYGDMWVLAKKVDAPRAPTKGRAIDHLGWQFDDLDVAAAELKTQGVKFKTGPYLLGGGKIAFIEGPDGVLIELVDRPRKP
jgi:catechol 2,3-dioxygenase-like lactoylglutathione lyase family enzyme